MDKLTKFLSKLSQRDRDGLLSVMEDLLIGDFTGLTVKKLVGHADLFRVRKGRFRIIFRQNEHGIFIEKVEKRDEKTYKNL